MKIVFSDVAWTHYQFWIETDRDMLAKVNRLIEDARRNLYRGLGKPEPLKNNLSGWWSRRISDEHRLVYRIVGRPNVDQAIEIAGCRYHYPT